MTNKKYLVLISILCMIVLIPAAFAEDNQTALTSDDVAQDILSGDYYFNSNIENDTGDGSKNNPYKELKADRIEDDSVIHLANGTYAPVGTVSVNNVKIIGDNAQNTTISSVKFNAYSLTLCNLTLSYSYIFNYGNLNAVNCIFKDSSSNINGGVISSNGMYNINITNCTFQDIYASSNGGAIYVSGGNLTISNSQFKNNYAKYNGGAVVADNDAKVTITKSKFINNYVTSEAGGAIYLIKSNLKASEIEMVNCTADFGGAIASLNSTLSLKNSIGRNNKAKYYGGCVFYFGDPGEFDIVNSILENNSAYCGGALFVDGAENFIINSNRFINNKANKTGEAIYSVFSDAYDYDFDDKELNNTFTNNNFYQTYIPDSFIGDNNYSLFKYNSLSTGKLPSTYDLRNLNQVTPVKNQGNGGNCWAFAAMASLESCILKATGTSLDLSEENMKNLMSAYSTYGWYMEPNMGGYDKMGVGYLLSWLGPINESDDEYNFKSSLSPVLDSFIHIQNILFLTRTNYTDNDAIKRAVMDYGGVATSIRWENSYLNGKNYYYNGYDGANHAITIVGWDDDYDASNFKSTPAGNGAWIIKNSWGTSGGDNGFYYVSYYDVRCAPLNKAESIYTFILNDSVKYDKNYQYDIPGKTDIFLNSSSTLWYKNRFNATDNEYLAAVSTYFEKDTKWDLSVYVNNALKLTQSGLASASYKTIELNNFIPLKKGDIFEILFKITVDGDASFPISESVSLNREFYKENISFLSYDGKTWVDLYNLEWAYTSHTYSSQVACIKAFTILNPINVNVELSCNNLNPCVVTAKVKNEYGYYVQNGKVTFDIDGKTIQADIVNGVSQITYTYDTIGTKTISASFEKTGYNRASSKITPTLKKDQVSISLNVVKNITSAQINVALSKNINETVYLKINNTNYNVKTVNGAGKLNLNNLYYGKYDVTAYIITDKFDSKNQTLSFTIDYLNTYINANNSEIFYSNNQVYSIKLLDKNSNPISGKTVNARVNNVNLSARTDSNGIATFKHNLAVGKYSIEIICNAEGKYLKSALNKTITVKSTIDLPQVVTYTYNSKYSPTLLDSKGNVLKNKEVALTIGVKTYSPKTDANGKLSYVIVLAPGTYNLIVNNLETGEVKNQTINVVKRISENKGFTMYFGAGLSYKVRVYDDNGNVANNVKVTFKINGKTYTRYTNANGYASLKISLAPKTYSITATYKNYKVSNKIVVRPTIIVKNVAVKKGKTLKFTAKLLNTKGKIIKYKKVTIKFKGKTYKAKTNSKGIATLKISTKKIKVGKYSIVTSYGKAKITKKITVKK